MDRRGRKAELDRREQELDHALTSTMEVMLFACQALQRVKLELKRARARTEVQEEMDRLFLRALGYEEEITEIARRWMACDTTQR